MNVKPAGANKLKYESDTSPVFCPFMGSELAKTFTVTINAKESATKIFVIVFTPLLFI